MILTSACLPVKSRITRVKSQGHDIRYPDSLHPFPDKNIQDSIILLEHSHNPSLCTLAHPCQFIMMPVLAFLTTELLILPAITYDAPALQTSRSLSLPFLFVIHREHFTQRAKVVTYGYLSNRKTDSEAIAKQIFFCF